MTLKDFHVKNFHIIDILFLVGPVKNVKNPVQQINSDHLAGFARTFQDKKYHVEFGIISVTSEKEDFSRRLCSNISEFHENFDGWSK